MEDMKNEIDEQDLIYSQLNVPEIKKKNPKLRIAIWIFIFLVAGVFIWQRKGDDNQVELVAINQEAEANQGLSPEINNDRVVSYTVAEGDIPADVFYEYGKFNANDMEALLLASEDIYDFSKIKIGRNIEFIFGENEKAKEIKYYLDTETVVIVELKDGEFNIQEQEIPYETKEETAQVKIDDFLYKDALEAGLSEASILEIADVFSFDIDFTTDIKSGDELDVIYEKRTLNGEIAPDGKILAAKFINNGQEYRAYYFQDGDEDGSHYDSEGHELMRQFLRAPLSYRKITSGYTGARFHPITKVVSAHYQIDYAAPVGTPVVATARGTVAGAGWEGGWGNMVRLKHDNGYTTHYGHLSAFGNGIKSGTAVVQGQVVGYVGSTGWSTGPHLDYGMKLNGNPVNPMSLQLPKGNPLEGEQLDKFQEVKQIYDQKLN